MRELLARLRASLSPQVLALLVALTLLIAGVAGKRDQTQLEKRIERTLSGVDGAGRVEVTIRMMESESGTSVIGMPKKTLSIPAGAVAVAQGADDPLVAIQLQDALCALLGLVPDAVSVIAGGK